MGPVWTMLLLATGPSPLAWIVGDWRCEARPVKAGGSTYVDEHWIENERGELVGVGRTHQLETSAIEHMKVTKAPDGTWLFQASPQGAPATSFRAVRTGPSEIVFENGGHDYPQRVSYRLDGERLVGTISRLDGSRAMSWRYVRQTPRPEGAWPACR